MPQLRLRLLLAFGSLLLVSTALAGESGQRSYDQGIEALRNFRYSVALMHFVAAAQGGHRNAQRNLGLIYLYGEGLYGQGIEKNLPQARHWLQQAASQGCDISRLMLQVLQQQGH